MDLSEQSERMQSFYNLKHDPFGAIVDSLVFSGAGGRYETSETIRHLLAFSQQNSLLVGASGSGKRTLAQQIIKSLDDQWRVAWIDGTDTDNVTDVFRELVGQFGLGLRLDTPANELLSRIISVTAERAKKEELFLVVIQFAEHLPSEVQLMLNQFNDISNDGDERVRLLWLASSLKDFPEPIDEHYWYIHTLEPFQAQDANQYIKDRLLASGNVQEQVIPLKDVTRLNQMANGLPMRLNELARDYLIGATFKTTEKKFTFPITHMVAGLAALCLVVIAVLYNLNDNPERIDVAVMDTPLAATQTLSAMEQKLADAVAKVEAKQFSAEVSTNQTVTSENSQPIETEAIVPPENEPVVPVIEAEKLAPSASKSEMIESKAAVIEPARKHLIDLGLDTEFTMQLIGVREKDKLETFLPLFKDQANVDIVETLHQNKPWFILIYGHFPTKAEAKLAVNSLPGEFSGNEPWFRSFKSVRDDIKK